MTHPKRFQYNFVGGQRVTFLLSELFTDNFPAVLEDMKARCGAIVSVTEVKWQNVTPEDDCEPRKRFWRAV